LTSRARFMNMWRYAPILPPYAFMACKGTPLPLHFTYDNRTRLTKFITTSQWTESGIFNFSVPCIVVKSVVTIEPTKCTHASLLRSIKHSYMFQRHGAILGEHTII
jgi:hypothetical protein